MIEHNKQKVQGVEKQEMDQKFRDGLKVGRKEIYPCVGEPGSVDKVIEIFRGLDCKYCGKPASKWIASECDKRDQKTGEPKE